MSEIQIRTPRALPPPRQSFLTRLAQLRRGPWEAVATTIIGAGVIFLMQPLSITLYSISFLTILGGTALFVIVSHFKD